jgi:hypothetical protein
MLPRVVAHDPTRHPNAILEPNRKVLEANRMIWKHHNHGMTGDHPQASHFELIQTCEVRACRLETENDVLGPLLTEKIPDSTQARGQRSTIFQCSEAQFSS